MNGQEIFNLLEGIRSDFVLEAEPQELKHTVMEYSAPPKRKRKFQMPYGAVVAILCCVVAIGIYVGILTGGFGLTSGSWFGFSSETEVQNPCFITGHEPTQWEETTPSTCYRQGEEQATCKVCENVLTRYLEKIPHTYANGVCTVCGMVEGANESFTIQKIEGQNEAIIMSHWTWIEYEEELILPNVYYDKNAGFLPVTQIGASACRQFTGVRRIIIPETVSAIGENAFADCKDLEEVVLPDTAVHFSEGVFLECDKLTTINFAKNQTVLSEHMFYGCDSLQNITLPQGITEIPNGTFGLCSSLQKIEIPLYVTSIGEGAFEGCVHLTELVLPNGITSIGKKAFYDCRSLATFQFSPGVETIEKSTFEGCISLREVDFGDNMTTIKADAFKNCQSLTELHFPAGMQVIASQAFTGCSNLAKITIANGNTQFHVSNGCLINTNEKRLYIGLMGAEIPTDGTVTSINGYAFAGRNISSITIPNTITEIGEYAFSGCRILTDIQLSTGVTKWDVYIFSDCTALEEIIIPDGLTEVGNCFFANCTSLKNVVIPEGFLHIPALMFSGCTSLQTITLPESLLTIGYKAFSDCTYLTNVTIPSQVYAIEADPFMNCPLLEVIQYQGNKSKWKEINSNTNWNSVCNQLIIRCYDGEITYTGKGIQTPSVGQDPCINGHSYEKGFCVSCGMIEGASNTFKIQRLAGKKEAVITGVDPHRTLTGEIIFPNVYFDNVYGIIPVTHIGDSLLENQTLVEKIVLPSTITHIGDKAFYNCIALTQVVFPAGLMEIGEASFMYCYELKSADLPDTVYKIGEYAFDSCTSLTSFVMPAALEYASSYMLLDCTSLSELVLNPKLGALDFLVTNSPLLTSIHIPASVTSLEENSFAYCENLQQITVAEDNEYFIGYGNLVIYKKDGTVWLGGCQVTFPQDIQITAIRDYAFAGRAIQEIHLPKGLSSIGLYAFDQCTKLKEITFDGNYCSLGNYAFRECSSLTEIDFPDHITFGDATFSNCSNLKTLYFDYMGLSFILKKGLFANCNKLTSIYFEGTCEQWQTKAIDADIALKRGPNDVDITVYCSDGEILYRYTP